MGMSLTFIRAPVVHLPLDPSAWSCINASSSDKCLQCVLSWLVWRRACQRETSLSGPSGHGESRCVSVWSWSELFFHFFPSNFAPALWDEIRASCPSWVQSQGVHIPPGESPLAPSHWPEGPEISKTKTGCPTPIAEHQPCVNGSCTVPPKSIFSKAHQNCALPPSHTLVHSPHCPLLKMWTESGFYLISDLVQAHISSISGTISVMNCRWSY